MHHELDSAAIDWLRSKSIAERIQMMGILNEMGRKVVADEIRLQWPEWNEEQVGKEVARRFLHDENLPELYAADYRESGIFDNLSSN
jgi:hypothetical protein